MFWWCRQLVWRSGLGETFLCILFSPPTTSSSDFFPISYIGILVYCWVLIIIISHILCPIKGGQRQDQRERGRVGRGRIRGRKERRGCRLECESHCISVNCEFLNLSSVPVWALTIITDIIQKYSSLKYLQNFMKNLIWMVYAFSLGTFIVSEPNDRSRKSHVHGNVRLGRLQKHGNYKSGSCTTLARHAQAVPTCIAGLVGLSA